MNPATLLSVLSAVAAAVWSVWTWKEDQLKERELKRNQEAALFVNSFMIAIDGLQSLLYSILEEDQLAWYREEYPDEYAGASPGSLEVLYRLSQYFGWGHTTLRYGPYTRDSRIIESIRQIGDAFGSRRRLPGDAFRFTIEERSALGGASVLRAGEVSAELPVFEALTKYEFEREFRDPASKHAPLFQSKAIRCSLAALDRATGPDQLEGRERLAVLQNYMVDLLQELEEKEGFSVSAKAQHKARLAPAVAPLTSTVATILHQTRGRVRIGVPLLEAEPARATRVQSLLERLVGVSSVRVNVDAASVVVAYSPAQASPDILQMALTAIEKALSS